MNKYLKNILFSDLSKWYVELYINRRTIDSKYQLVSLGKLITPSGILSTKEDYDNKIKIIDKIRFSDGKVFFREENVTNMNVYYSIKGELIASKINLHQGAIAINNFGTIACTTHYQPYQVNNNLIDIKYLLLVLRSDYFKAYLTSIKAKGIKNESGYDFIKTIKIPLPSIEEQKKLVQAYLASTSVLSNNESIYLEKYNNLFVSKLFAYDYAIKENKGVLFDTVNLSALTRWDSWEKSTGLKSKIFKVVPFEKLIDGKPQYGANVRGVDTKCEYRYIRITDINEDGTLNDDVKYPEEVEEKFILKNNDFLIARSGNTVGKTYLYKEEIGKAIYAGYLVRYVINDKIALPEYVFYYTKSVLFKNWVIKNQRIAGQPNINGQEYLAAPFILPPISVQSELIKDAKYILKLLKDEKETTRLAVIKAKINFENAIFS